MPLQTTQAYVLRTYTLAEADKICVFLTRDCGKVRGVAHGARKMKSRFGSALEPLTEVALTYFFKEGRELVSVSTCDITRSSFYIASRSYETASALAYMAELLSEFLPDNEPNERLYRLVMAALAAIEATPEADKLWQLLRYFETWLLRLTGYFPDLAQCAACQTGIEKNVSAFLTVEGSPRCLHCSSGRGAVVDTEMRHVISEIFRAHPHEFATQLIPAKRLQQIGEMNYQIIRHALERDLRSRALLKQLALGQL
ncbi:MAG: DNA repair protein RecO [Acidobacteria bacterium]|nr:DNA repair protein RecO [Acidobacteriota bacterium]